MAAALCQKLLIIQFYCSVEQAKRFHRQMVDALRFIHPTAEIFDLVQAVQKCSDARRAKDEATTPCTPASGEQRT
ncbi:MAG: hypothetical protein CSYNP_03412 [Syntrophus sp. SKADARSKE-3]|nr:hypothetical protein [Syntrophus sp. SKADARSKE-3]